jgi:hypothetical protein
VIAVYQNIKIINHFLLIKEDNIMIWLPEGRRRGRTEMKWEWEVERVM